MEKKAFSPLGAAVKLQLARLNKRSSAVVLVLLETMAKTGNNEHRYLDWLGFRLFEKGGILSQILPEEVPAVVEAYRVLHKKPMQQLQVLMQPYLADQEKVAA